MSVINVPDEIELTLRKPIKDGDQMITSLTLREPTVREMGQAGSLPNVFDSNAKLVSLVSGVPKLAIQEMGIGDMQKAVDFLAHFTRSDRQDGS